MSTRDHEWSPGLTIDGFYLSGDCVDGWKIAWRDTDTGSEICLPTVYGGGGSGDSFREAAEALEKYANSVRRTTRLNSAEADLQILMIDWINRHAVKLSRLSN